MKHEFFASRMAAVLLLASGTLFLSACQDPPPPPVPGQPLTYQQKFYQDLEKAQIRHQERPDSRGGGFQ